MVSAIIDIFMRQFTFISAKVRFLLITFPTPSSSSLIAFVMAIFLAFIAFERF